MNDNGADAEHTEGAERAERMPNVNTNKLCLLASLC
jgi:hypothetical protein